MYAHMRERKGVNISLEMFVYWLLTSYKIKAN